MIWGDAHVATTPSPSQPSSPPSPSLLIAHAQLLIRPLPIFTIFVQRLKSRPSLPPYSSGCYDYWDVRLSLSTDMDINGRLIAISLCLILFSRALTSSGPYVGQQLQAHYATHKSDVFDLEARQSYSSQNLIILRRRAKPWPKWALERGHPICEGQDVRRTLGIWSHTIVTTVESASVGEASLPLQYHLLKFSEIGIAAYQNWSWQRSNIGKLTDGEWFYTYNIGDVI